MSSSQRKIVCENPDHGSRFRHVANDACVQISLAILQTESHKRTPLPNDLCFHSYGVDLEVYPCNQNRRYHELFKDVSNSHEFVEGVPRGQLKELRAQLTEALDALIY